MKTLPTLVLAVAATVAHAQVATLTLLPDSHKARALSADGKTVLLDSLTSEYWERGLYDVFGRRFDFWTSAGGLTPGGVFEAGGMSADGTVVGGARWTGAFRFTTGGGTEALPLLPAMGNPGPYADQRLVAASSVSGDGRMVFGRLLSGGKYRAVRWTPSGVEELANAGSSTLAAASHDGLVAVGEAGFQAVRWTAVGGTALLGNPPGTTSSSATAVSADGRLAFGRAESSGDDQGKVPPVLVGFRWSAATGTVALDGLGRVDAATPDGRLAIGPAYAPAFHWNPVTGPGRPGGGPGRPGATPTGRWWRNPATKIWDARGGVLDLRAMMMAQGLTGFQGAIVESFEELDIVGIAYDMGVLTVVAADGYGLRGFRATLAYDPAPLQILISLGGLRTSPTRVPVTVELRRSGTLDAVQRATVFPGTTSRAVVNAPAAGTYDVSLSAPRFLRRTLKGVALSGGAADLAASLIAGDVDGNNRVDAVDLNRVKLALNSVLGGPRYDAAADLDDNGVVDRLDFALVAAAVGKVGDR